jgi:hypothetical protein
MVAESNYGMSEQAIHSIELGDAIRQMASAIFLGTFDKDNIRKYKGLNSTDEGIDAAIEKIEKMRDAILERGFTILNTNVPIYGTKRNGQGISALADIVIMDNDGNIGLIDVLYSAFEDIEGHMYGGYRSGDRRRGMLDREQKLLTSSKEVLYNMFGSNFIQA